jgi:capsule polysaccharide export protein KpsE/RkpR
MSAPANRTRPDFSPEQSLRELGTPLPAPGSAPARLIGHLGLLWGQRREVGRWTLGGLLLATLVAFLLPKQYQSSAQLMPPETQSGSGAMLAALSAKASGGVASVAGDLLGGNSTGALFLGILRSRTLEERLVERFDLKRVYGTKLEEDARSKLANNTGISEDHRSGIISISVVDQDPARSQAIAQAYMAELEHLVSELSTSAAHRERVFLEGRRQAVKRELDQAAEEFSQFASNNTAINIPEQGKAMVQAAAALQGQLIAAESELKGLSEIYTANNVRVRSVEARVSELRRQLEKLDGDSGPAKTDAAKSPGAKSAEARNAEVKNPGVKNEGPKNGAAKNDGPKNEAAANTGGKNDPTGKETLPAERSAYPTIRELPLLGVTYSDLMRRAKIQEAVYETLTQQYELAKVQEAKETPSVKVLDAANLPEKKVFPPRLLIMVWGTLLGLAAATFRVVCGNRWRQLDSGDPGKLLAREVLQTVHAVMPWKPPNGSRVHALTHRMWTNFAHRKHPPAASAAVDSAHDCSG